MPGTWIFRFRVPRNSEANADNESVVRCFTERRLRELTRLKGNEKRMKRFRKMIEKEGFASGG